MTVAEIEAALKKHQDERPDHLAAMRPDSPPDLRRRWEKWVARKFQLQEQLELARGAEVCWRDVQTGLAVDVVVPVTPDQMRVGPRVYKEQPKITAETYALRRAACLERMAMLDPATKEWDIERRRAGQWGSLAKLRAAEDGEPVPEMPKMPTRAELDPEYAEELRGRYRASKARASERLRARKEALRGPVVQLEDHPAVVRIVTMLPLGALSSRQAAEYLDVTKRSLLKWRSDRRGPECLEYRGCFYYMTDALDKWKRKWEKQTKKSGVTDDEI